MHIPPYFRMSKKACFQQLGLTAFGQLITHFNGQIIQTYVPFMIDEKKHCLYGHIAKQNQQVESLKSDDGLTVTFLGSNGYISPNWYQSNEQVPTWNYQAVEIKGNAELLDNQGTLKVIDQLSQYHEAQFEEPWKIEKLSNKKLNAMLNAIVGFKVNIAEINGISKMSQNKSTIDQQGVVNGLNQQANKADHRVAKIISDNLKRINKGN